MTPDMSLTGEHSHLNGLEASADAAETTDYQRPAARAFSSFAYSEVSFSTSSGAIGAGQSWNRCLLE